MQDVILLESYGIPWKTKYQLRLGSRNVFRKFSFESANTSAFSWPKYWMINPRQKHGRRKGGLEGSWQLLYFENFTKQSLFS